MIESDVPPTWSTGPAFDHIPAVEGRSFHFPPVHNDLTILDPIAALDCFVLTDKRTNSHQ